MSRPVVFRSGRSALKVEDSVEVWRGRAGSLVESGMTANARCEENRVGKPASHRWLRRFRDEGPGLFGGFEAAHAGDGRRNRYEAVRRANAGGALPAGAEASACMCSLVGTAGSNGLEPRAWLEWVLTEMPRLGEPQALSDADVERFLPWSEGVPEGCRQLKKPRP